MPASLMMVIALHPCRVTHRNQGFERQMSSPRCELDQCVKHYISPTPVLPVNERRVIGR